MRCRSRGLIAAGLRRRLVRLALHANEPVDAGTHRAGAELRLKEVGAVLGQRLVVATATDPGLIYTEREEFGAVLIGPLRLGFRDNLPRVT
jgi:hypothetical protein